MACILQENRNAEEMEELVKRYGDILLRAFWLGEQGKKDE